MGFLILSSYDPKCSDLHHGGHGPRAAYGRPYIALTCGFVVRVEAFRGSTWTRQCHPARSVENYQTILTKMQIISKGSHPPTPIAVWLNLRSVRSITRCAGSSTKGDHGWGP